ncbi:MAG: hypothetical protein JXA22_10350 [Candidatus Thermoplasmatota archaeon]|nr:hypothetical protein [Candidatus Thermoplasmatota archaeon]
MTKNREKERVKKDTIKVVRASDHRSHYIIGAVPQWTDDDLRLHLYNEVIEGVGGPYYISSAQIILPRSAVPRLNDALRSAVRSDGEGKRSEVTSIPMEVSLEIDSENYKKDKKPQRKKVPKIRRK